MRLIAVKALKPGDILGEAIRNGKGQVLLQAGFRLTASFIERLNDYAVTYVYIDDLETSDINRPYPLSDELRIRAVKTIKDSFQELQASGQMEQGYMFDKMGSEMMGLVRSIMDELQEKKEVLSLLSDIFTYDHYIFTHSLNVTLYSLALGKELNLPAVKLEEIGLGALLHDVGKMTIPRDILLKPGKLTNEEFTIMKEHAEAGFEILRNSANIPLVAAHCAYQHHERLNGSGYPRGIEESDIHVYGKILAIADVFDAVTSNRTYRSAKLPHEGLEVLYAGSATLFDQGMVEAFRRCIAVYPNGLSVKLSDERSGVVSRQNPHLCDRPVVRILEDSGGLVSDKYEVDLSVHLNIMITDCDIT